MGTNINMLYAPPNFWSKWYKIGAEQGPQSVKIVIDPVGSTQVLGKVRYWKHENRQVEKEFLKDIKIWLGNVHGSVEVKLKGLPFGSAVRVTLISARSDKKKREIY